MKCRDVVLLWCTIILGYLAVHLTILNMAAPYVPPDWPVKANCAVECAAECFR